VTYTSVGKAISSKEDYKEVFFGKGLFYQRCLHFSPHQGIASKVKIFFLVKLVLGRLGGCGLSVLMLDFSSGHDFRVLGDQQRVLGSSPISGSRLSVESA